MVGQRDSYAIPFDVEHRIEIIKTGEVLYFFCPLRKGYLNEKPTVLKDALHLRLIRAVRILQRK